MLPLKRLDWEVAGAWSAQVGAMDHAPGPNPPESVVVVSPRENAKVGQRTQQMPKGATFGLGGAKSLEMAVSLAVKGESLAVRTEHADLSARSRDAAHGGNGHAFIFRLGLEG